MFSNFNIIHIICENFRIIVWVLYKMQLILFERVRIESHKIWNLGSSLCFSEVMLISFVMPNNTKKRHSECEMHEVHYGSDLRLYDGYGISFPSVGQRLMFVFSWAHCGSTGFSLALTVSDSRTIFFVSWQYVYILKAISNFTLLLYILFLGIGEWYYKCV